MNLTITATQLRAKKACADQLALFVATYGDSVTFTSEADLARAAATSKLDLQWFAEHFLPRPLSAEYERQHAPIWAKHVWAALASEPAP